MVNPSAFLVNVSATVPISSSAASGSGGANGANGGAGASSPAAGSSPDAPKEVDADQLVRQLVGNPDTFQRTTQTTGAGVEVKYLNQQLVPLHGRDGDLNVHAIVWPTLTGTLVLAVVVALGCGRYCRRRRRLRAGLPAMVDAPGFG